MLVRNTQNIMAFNEQLALRMRNILADQPGIVEKKMFGGVAFLQNGNVLIGVWKDDLIVRLGPEHGAAALREPFVREFDITGKPMKGWVMVTPEGTADDRDLRDWIAKARSFVKQLPAK